MTLKQLVKEIDSIFGEGYAKANPALVSNYLIADVIGEVDKTLASAIEILDSKIGKLNILKMFK